MFELFCYRASGRPPRDGAARGERETGPEAFIRDLTAIVGRPDRAESSGDSRSDAGLGREDDAVARPWGWWWENGRGGNPYGRLVVLSDCGEMITLERARARARAGSDCWCRSLVRLGSRRLWAVEFDHGVAVVARSPARWARWWGPRAASRIGRRCSGAARAGSGRWRWGVVGAGRAGAGGVGADGGGGEVAAGGDQRRRRRRWRRRCGCAGGGGPGLRGGWSDGLGGHGVPPAGSWPVCCRPLSRGPACGTLAGSQQPLSALRGAVTWRSGTDGLSNTRAA